MDIYTHHLVPFSAGVWARSHKFHPAAVKLTQALLKHRQLQLQMDQLELQRDKLEASIKSIGTAIEQYMEGGNGN